MATDYLRISITDRCNLRCIYCCPDTPFNFIDHVEILRFEEIERLVKLFAKCGIRKVRITGGEPLVRKNIAELINKISAIEEIQELALTTNGVLLESMAQDLKDAGLDRINISIDSIEQQNYKRIAGFDHAQKTISGIHKAIKVGLTPVKINSVIIDGINDSQIIPLAKMSVDLPVSVRYIEYCPTDTRSKPAGNFIPSSATRSIIEKQFGKLSPVSSSTSDGPALHYKIKDSAGTIGFISGRSSIFCSKCNRLRLTSDGMIKPCLYSSKYYDIKQMLRSGRTDRQITGTLNKIIKEKSGYTKLNSPDSRFDMHRIGG